MALAYVGKPCARVDAWEKVTGKARYAADYHLARELAAKSLYSRLRMLESRVSMGQRHDHCPVLSLSSPRRMCLEKTKWMAGFPFSSGGKQST